MTVGEFKKYLSMLNNDIELTFEFTDKDMDNAEYQRTFNIYSIEISQKICCFRGLDL